VLKLCEAGEIAGWIVQQGFAFDDGRWTGGGGEDSESQRWAGGIDGGE
jgi:hypothetical protein